jgi:hypothetical protein
MMILLHLRLHTFRHSDGFMWACVKRKISSCIGLTIFEG